jgi:hypothetical protein
MIEDNKLPQDDSFLKILLWTARIIGTLFVLGCIFMFVSSLLENNAVPVRNSSFSPDAWDGLMITTGIFFLLGISGLIVALQYEGEGGLVAFVGMLLFIILTKYNPKANFHYYYLAVLIPSLLYLFYWWHERRKRE